MPTNNTPVPQFVQTTVTGSNGLFITNEDNMALMSRYPDNYFDLAIVDPPYGSNALDGSKTAKKYGINRSDNWDCYRPKKEYFIELQRVSKNQIIWGGNYFTEYLQPTKAWIFWYKGQRDLTMSDGEMAWTSLNTVTRQFELNRAALIAQNTFHPTEKPYRLYEWILNRYANEGDKILDTHLGSASIAIAVDRANKMDKKNFTLIACELDKEYFDKSILRIKENTNWQSLF
jgi:site-specific DNA-methyltransferase (adenine-specific)